MSSIREWLRCACAAFVAAVIVAAPAQAEQGSRDAAPPDAGDRSVAQAEEEVPRTCIECHEGIAPIRAPESEMYRQIVALGQAHGPNGRCLVCHGGTSPALMKALSGSVWVSSKLYANLPPLAVPSRTHFGLPPTKPLVS